MSAEAAPGRLGDAETYGAIRSSAAYVLRPVDVITVAGPDASSWLQGQLSQDLDQVAPGSSAETLVLSPQGKVDAYASIARSRDDMWRLVVASPFGEPLLDRLRRFKLRVKAELMLEPGVVAMVRGPGAGGLANWLAAVHTPLAELEAAWTGFSGLDLVFGDASVEGFDQQEGSEAGFEARRIEAGVPMLGREITEKTIAQEAGLLVEHTVSFTKGCYTGQELVARIDARGGNVPRRLRLLRFEGSDTAPAPQAGDEIVDESGRIGELTSVAFSPGAGAYVALGYLKRAATVPGSVRVTLREGGGQVAAQAAVLPGTAA